MAQDELITPQQLFGALVPTIPSYSLTRLIGGKLRALYDDDAQPYPERLAELIGALDGDQAAH
jgi:hypothetical protein